MSLSHGLSLGVLNTPDPIRYQKISEVIWLFTNLDWERRVGKKIAKSLSQKITKINPVKMLMNIFLLDEYYIS